MHAVENGNLLASKFDNPTQSMLGYNGEIYWVTFGSKILGADIQSQKVLFPTESLSTHGYLQSKNK